MVLATSPAAIRDGFAHLRPGQEPAATRAAFTAFCSQHEYPDWRQAWAAFAAAPAPAEDRRIVPVIFTPAPEGKVEIRKTESRNNSRAAAIPRWLQLSRQHRARAFQP